MNDALWAQDSLDGHTTSGPHRISAAEGTSSPQTRMTATPIIVPSAGSSTTPTPWNPALNGDLATAADTLNDIEHLRIATENRLRQFTRALDEEDKDGGQRGFGWDLRSPAVASLAALLATMKCDSQIAKDVLGEDAAPKPNGCCFVTLVHYADGTSTKEKNHCLEHGAERNLTRALRAHPLGPWVKAQKGVGEKQGARLIGAIGNPYMRPELLLPDGTIDPARPRLVAELRAYCGFGEDKTNPGHIQKKARGQRANWSAAAKMRAFLVAESCMKGLRKPCERVEGDDFAIHVEDCECSPYRLIYDRERARYQNAVHDEECVRCGPAGSPAPAGSPLPLAHKKGRALRRVAKEILDDLWREARRIHLETPTSGQPDDGIQSEIAAGGD